MAGSFTQDTKELLAVLPVKKPHCRRAELSALAASLGVVEVEEEGRLLLALQSENLSALSRCDYLVRTLSKGKPELSVLRGAGVRAPLYTLILREPGGAAELLKTLGFMTARGVLREPELAAPAHLLKEECCRRAFIRGAFLAGGFVSDPNASYHLEIVTRSEARSRELQGLLEGFGLSARVTERKNQSLVYVKDAESISDFLSLVGASRSRLEWENVRILRGIQGQVNRQVNCETANLSKTVNAGVKQIEAIRRIEREQGLEALPENLQEIARLRLENPELSLPELGALMEPPLGKSGVNHRLRRLMEIAESL